MTTDLHFLTIAEAAELIRTRKLSPVEYTDALIKRIEAFEPQLNAFITRTFDSRAMRRARRKPTSPPAVTAGRCTAFRSR